MLSKPTFRTPGILRDGKTKILFLKILHRKLHLL